MPQGRLSDELVLGQSKHRERTLQERLDRVVKLAEDGRLARHMPHNDLKPSGWAARQFKKIVDAAQGA